MMTIKNQYLNFEKKTFKVKNKLTNKKSIIHNHFKPKNYYNRLIVFFAINSVLLTLTLVEFKNLNLEIFLMKFIIIFMLILTLSAIIEFKYQSEYISLIEVHNLETFFKNFLKSAYDNPLHIESKFFNKYDSRTKKKFKKLFNIKHKYFLSSIKKEKGVFEITFINNNKLYEFFLLKFLIKNAIHKAYIKKINSKYVVIDFN